MNSFTIHFYVPSDVRSRIRQVVESKSRDLLFIVGSLIEGWFAKYGINIPTSFSQVLVGRDITTSAMSGCVVLAVCISDDTGVFEEGGEVILNMPGTGVISNSGRLEAQRRPASRSGSLVLLGRP